jgi:mono/diheme cytochrome c family protein
MHTVKRVGGNMRRIFMFVAVLGACARTPLASQPESGPVGHLPPDRSTVPPVAMTAHKLTPGEVLFLRHCAGCHGAGARGDGPVGVALGLRPRNLRQAGLFPEDHDPAWINRILHGKAMPVSVQSSQMLASDTEVADVVQHLRRLPTLSWPDIDRGEKVYDSLCLSCHGVYGHGDGPVAQTLPAPPRDLVAPPYQQQMTDAALFQVISEGKGAMPGSADVLSVDDRQAVVAFVRLLTPGYESYDRYCVGCHGHKGHPASREILDLLGQGDAWAQPPALDKEFFRTRTEEQLRKGVHHMLTLNRAPMPHFAGELTADQVQQVLSYLRSLPPES